MFGHDLFLDFTDIEPRLQVYHKCIKAKLAGASVSVFEDNNNDNEDIDERKIQHKSDDKDTISDDTAGYIQTMVGDSGGPYWTYDAVLDNKMRATVVAIHNDSVGRRLRVTVDKSKKCRMTSTKITEDILVWIKEISGTALCIKN